MEVCISIFGLLFALMIVQGHEPSPEDEKILRGCLKAVEMSEDYVNKLTELLDFNNPKIKCLHACIIKNRGGLVNGKVDEEKDLLIYLKNFSKETKDIITQNKAVITDCAKKANEEKDECELITSYVVCGMKIVLPQFELDKKE